MPTKYLKYIVYNLVAATGLYVVLMLYVDPTSLLTVGGYKPGLGCTGGMRTNVYNIKPAVLALHDFDTIIFGSSRVANGIDTNSLVSVLGVPDGYNAGSPGLHSDNLIKYLNIISGKEDLHHVYIGLDLGMFMEDNYDRVNTGVMFDYLERNPVHSSLDKIMLFIRSHIFKESVTGSIKALLSKPDCTDPKGAALGHMAVRNFASKIIKYGYRSLANDMLEKTKMNFQRNSHDNLASNNYQELRDNIKKLGANLDQLCKPARSIVIFTNPVHADIMVALDDTFPGIVSTYKNALIRMVDDHARNGCNITLWDFNVIHPYTTTRFPDNHNPDDDSTYFWELSHYKRALGEILLHKMHGDSDNNFGVMLNAGNIDRHLAKQQMLLDEYRQKHAQ